MTIPPGAETIGRIVSDETTMKVEFLERSKSDGFESVDSKNEESVVHFDDKTVIGKRKFDERRKRMDG